MRKRIILAALALVMLDALSGRDEARAANPCTVPREWGQLKAMAAGSMGTIILAFEAQDGTIRTVPANCKTPANAIDTVFRLP